MNDEQPLHYPLKDYTLKDYIDDYVEIDIEKTGDSFFDYEA